MKEFSGSSTEPDSRQQTKKILQGILPKYFQAANDSARDLVKREAITKVIEGTKGLEPIVTKRLAAQMFSGLITNEKRWHRERPTTGPSKQPSFNQQKEPRETESVGIDAGLGAPQRPHDNDATVPKISGESVPPCLEDDDIIHVRASPELRQLYKMWKREKDYRGSIEDFFSDTGVDFFLNREKNIAKELGIDVRRFLGINVGPARYKIYVTSEEVYREGAREILS